MITYDVSRLTGFVPSEVLAAALAQIGRQARTLHDRSGPGSEMLGWLDLPERSQALMPSVGLIADEIRQEGATLICIGIGGSYLGANAAITALAPDATVVFAGHHLSPSYLQTLMDRLTDRPVYLNVISKSGTTTESGVTFRILGKWLKSRYPKSWRRRIIVTTDPAQGALRQLAEAEKLRSLPIPPDVGGRFSVLSAVGLLPIAAAGIDISAMLTGARDQLAVLTATEGEGNPAQLLAAVRSSLYERGTKIEVLATFHPELQQMAEWWKQLAGESEGKDHRGLFPAACTYTTDLHSLGQWLQEGERTVMETFLWVEDPGVDLIIPDTGHDTDGLAYLAGTSLAAMNRKVFAAVTTAHTQGGVPCSTVTMPRLDAAGLGALFIFFEVAVALTGYQLGINPFNQPGVEAYKQEMFKRLGKPGYTAGK